MTTEKIRAEIARLRESLPPVPEGVAPPEDVRRAWNRFWALHILLHDAREEQRVRDESRRQGRY